MTIDMRLAQLMDEHPQIQELDITPLILYARGEGAAVARRAVFGGWLFSRIPNPLFP